jgi:hypothetical protein
MINHLRTLLLNQPYSAFPGADYFMEEYVSPDFLTLVWPDYLRRIRAVLFGASPDRAMLNYRLAQCLSTVRTCQLSEYLLRFDARIAEQRQYTRAFTMATIPSATSIVGDSALDLFGEAESPDAAGILQHRWLVEVTANSGIEMDVLVTTQTPARSPVEATYTVTSGLSAPISLPTSYFQCRVRSAAQVGDQWAVEYLARPTWDIGAIVAALEQLDMTVFQQLFGAGSAEPLATFEKLWRSKIALYRLAGTVLAMGERLEQVRLKSLEL